MLSCQHAEAIRCITLISKRRHPCLADGRIVLGKAFSDAKDDIAARLHLRKFCRNAFCRICTSGIPAFEECCNGTCRRTVKALEDVKMLLLARLMALLRAFRFSFVRASENILRIVAKELGTDARRTFCWLWHLHDFRHLDILLPTLHRFIERQKPQGGPILCEFECPADFRIRPAVARRTPFIGFPFIIFDEFCEDHRSTSTFRTSSTPFWRAARKNIGWIFRTS